MPKLRRQRKRQVYRHNVNRKRMRNKMFNRGKIGCGPVKQAWDERKSVQQNMKDMGLMYDPNDLKNPKVQESLQEFYPHLSFRNSNKEWKEEVIPPKQYVAEELEADAKAPRERLLRLPKSQVEWLSYLIIKYGSDFKAMARDKKNYYQETWKQLRQKIKRFRGIPEQYNQFLQERGYSEDPVNLDCGDDSD